MRNLLSAAVLSSAILVPLQAVAEEGAACGSAPKDQWMSHESLKRKVAELGYEVRKIKTERGCYEVYAISKEGKKEELYFNPASGERVQRKDNE